jgi:hypothetical protein
MQNALDVIAPVQGTAVADSSDGPNALDLIAPVSGTSRVDESAFQKWYAERAKRLKLNADPDAPEHQYDYRAAYAAKAEPDASGHWPSAYKREGHPNLVVDGVNTKTGEAVDDPLIKYQGVLSSVVPKKRQAQVVSSILGHDVPAKPENPTTLADLSRAVKESWDGPPGRGPITAVGKTALGLTGLPAIFELLKTGVETGPDIVRGLLEHPAETIRGGVAGTAEGVMEEASPLNAVMLALGLRGKLRGKPPARSPLAPTKTAGPLGNTAKVTGVPAGGGELVLPELPTTMPARSAWPGAERTPLEVAQAKARAALAEAKPVKSVDDFAAMMEKKGATVGEALKTGASTAAEAADEIERSVKQGIKELRDLEGSEKAGARIFGTSKTGGILDPVQRKAVIKQIAPGPSKTPKVAEEAMRNAAAKRKLSDEKGAVNPKILGSIAGGTAGAAVGATQGEMTEERVRNAALFGLGGAASVLAVPMIAHALASGSAQKTMQNYLYTSVLSSPQSVIKAYSGAAGGAVGAAVELIETGNVKRGTAILNTLFSRGSIAEYKRALKNPATAQLSGTAAQAPTIIGRIFGAGDAVARRAMKAGGISDAEAARYTLSGVPTTPVGQYIVGGWNQFFILRLTTSLFPRVGVQIVERGLERSPFGLLKMKGINEGVSTGTRVARAATGTAAGTGAYLGADQVPDWAKPYLVALGGVYGLPVAVGFAAAEGAQGDGSVLSGIDEGVEAVAKNLPFPQFGPFETLKQYATGAPLVPNIVRDVARAGDPHERKTDTKSGGFFARTKAKIPGLRETLPVKGANVNISGESNQDRSSAVTRFFTPSSPRQNKWKDVPEKVASELKRLDVEVNAPSFNAYARDEALGKIKIPPDILERARTERREFLLPYLQIVMDTPAYRQGDDATKKRLLEAAKTRAEAEGSAKARAHVIQLLQASGKLPN